jgi:hypothetical protein
MVLWYVVAGADWDDIGRLSQGWGNADEIALAKQFVAGLGSPEKPVGQSDPGVLYWEMKGEGAAARDLADGLRTFWAKYPVVGLAAKEKVPDHPGAPALACRMTVSDETVTVTLDRSHPSGSDWVSLGTLRVALSDLTPSEGDTAEKSSKAPSPAARLADRVVEGALAKLVRVQLARGPKVKGKESFRVTIVNESPMILNGLALGGRAAETRDGALPSVLSGLSVPPRKSLTVSASADMVERLQLKNGLRVVAADLSGL